ncbi:MAG: hypothetical protein P5702_14250 [Limnospira sp. PMC 1291.21]|uniref:hypothetical protein n=1 Tax=Limnospira TaxID=2596745 RepID=UPI000320CB53|nr:MULTISPECIES: hypothetical protein [Limnospira]MDC0839175.1 hypothetical protein [Limnoraphis robusta]MDT9178497.1 hypothetical protein [Limnospira sp. PMC 1238.20]MDT9316592.1 hypothetical protein [Limnospira sp. PMC 1306.21]MDY7054179.1 hypothetical protein [Limnospira fusiformis LS22]MDT9188701.1 hypothetical protein [Limnospira sp. PMC 894.15]
MLSHSILSHHSPELAMILPQNHRLATIFPLNIDCRLPLYPQNPSHFFRENTDLTADFK